jgi:ATP-binding cassette, subfamily B, bacterial
MVAKYFGHEFKIQTLREYCQINRDGVSLLGLCEAAESIGLKSIAAKISVKRLNDMELPCILHWRQNHFVVLYKLKRGEFYIADPAVGLFKLNETAFKRDWIDNNATEKTGLVILLNPMGAFYEQKKEKNAKVPWALLIKYFITFRKLFIQLIIGLFIASLLQLIAPFFTQHKLNP